jgi:hypothetical protein
MTVGACSNALLAGPNRCVATTGRARSHSGGFRRRERSLAGKSEAARIARRRPFSSTTSLWLDRTFLNSTFAGRRARSDNPSHHRSIDRHRVVEPNAARCIRTPCDHQSSRTLGRMSIGFIVASARHEAHWTNCRNRLGPAAFRMCARTRSGRGLSLQRQAAFARRRPACDRRLKGSATRSSRDWTQMRFCIVISEWSFRHNRS